MLVSRTCWAFALGLFAVTGCRSLVPAPYARGKAPSSAELLEHTGAQLPALQVSKAKVVANRTQRGNLAFLAEAPGRFRGTIDVAGNELITLAFHEQGYALRYKLDAFPEGFYAGPPSACAVEALLGVSFDTEGLVDLVLGGAPVIAGPHEVLEQKWDRKQGFERLVIANPTLVQELRFGWVGNEWRVMGGQLWERSTTGERGRRLWTVEHMELEPVGKAWLPSKTKVSTPGKRRDDTVVISYKERDPDPAFAKREGGATDGGDTGDEPWGDDDGGDPWEEDEGGWEGEGEAPPASGEAAGDEDEGGWEGGEGMAATPEAAAKPGEATAATDAAQSGDTTPPATQPTTARPKTKPTKPAAPTIPPEFQLEPSGLTVRGDLCH